MGCSGRVVNTVRILNNGMKMIIHVVFCCAICLITESEFYKTELELPTGKYANSVFDLDTTNLKTFSCKNTSLVKKLFITQYLCNGQRCNYKLLQN